MQKSIEQLHKETEAKYKIKVTFSLEDHIINIPSVYTGRAINAVFRISSKKAREIIKSDSIEPNLIYPGCALLVITIFEFLESPVGPYKELVYSIPVSYKPKINFFLFPLIFPNLFKNSGVHVIDVIQSTSIAVRHGDILTGYPHNKKLIDFTFPKNIEDYKSISINSNGEKFLELDYNRVSQNEKQEKSEYMTYFYKDTSYFKIQMDIYGKKKKLKKCTLKLHENILTKDIIKLDIKPNAIQSFYYPIVSEVNPVDMKKL